MDHPLRNQVRRVARQVRLLLLIRGAACFFAAAVFLVLSLGLIDFLWRARDAGLRALLSGGAVALIGWTFWRYLLPVLRYRSEDITIARWIERARPDLRDELSSAVAFLSAAPDDRAAGSPQLRMAHVQHVAARLAQHPLRRPLRFSYSLRPVVLLAFCVLLLVTACWADPASAQLAALRVLSPWNDLRWPRRNQIVLVNPITRLAIGQDFEAIVMDKNGELPPDVTIHYWYEGTTADEIEHVAMNYAGGRMFHRLTNVTRPFRYRVTGGDDDTMGWLRLTLLQPPEINEITARIDPPPYTGWEAYEVSGPFSALKDSRAEVRVALSEPIAQLMLRADPGVMNNDTTTTSLPIDLDPAGQQGRSPTGDQAWLVGQSGRYWLEIVARNELRIVTRTWEVQSLEDEAPGVTMTHGAAGAVVGARAKLPIVAHAKDDIALQEIRFQVNPGTDKQSLGNQSVDGQRLMEGSLWAGPTALTPGSRKPLSGDDERSATGVLDLATLSLQPGQFIQLIASARDYKPQEGHSSAVSLHIVSDAELEDRLAQLQSRLLAAIDQAVRDQREATGQTQQLEAQLEERADIRARDADVLKGVELHQRRIAESIATAPESLLAQASGISNEIRINQLAMPGLEQQMATVIRTLEGWSGSELPHIERSLLSASKELAASLEISGRVSDALKQSLQQTSAAQQDLLNQLEQLAAQLAGWEGFRRFAGEVRDLVREQQRVLADSSALRSETLGRDLSQLNPEQRALLKRITQRQMNIVRRTDDLSSRLRAAAAEMQQRQDEVAAMLANATEVLEREGIAAAMRAGAQAAEANKLSESVARQQQAIAGLNELLNSLTGRRQGTTAPANASSAAAQNLANVAREQEEIDQQRRELAAAGPDASAAQRQAVAERQEQLAARVAELAQRLANAASPAAEALGQAAQAMHESAAAIRTDDLGRADEQAAVAHEALEEAAQQLASSAAAEQQLESAQLNSELRQGLETLRTSQLLIQKQTTEFEDLRSAQSVFSPEQQRAVRELSGQQQVLSVKTRQLAERAASWKTFAYLLNETADDLSEAAARLLQLDTRSDTQQLQAQAVARMSQMLAALEQMTADNKAEGNSTAQPPAAQQPSQNQRQFSIEELELLQILQADLAVQTEELEKRRSAESQSESWQRQQRQLAEEQGRLEDLLLRVLTNESSQ